jgi:hypothetical protein
MIRFGMKGRIDQSSGSGMRLEQIGRWWLLALLSVLATMGCDNDGVLGEVDPDPPEPALVRLIPAQLVYQVGDPVGMHAFIEHADNVGSVPFHLVYNKDVLEFLPPATEGPFMREDGTFTVFLVDEAGGGGELVVGLSRLGAVDGAQGSGLLATFAFTALSPGSSAFEFRAAKVKDPQARSVPATFSVFQIRVDP